MAVLKTMRDDFGNSNVVLAVDEVLSGPSIQQCTSNILKDVRCIANTNLGTVVRAVARKEGGFDVLENLGLNPYSAIDFYMKAIQEERHTRPITLLGNVFKEGGAGIERNIPRAIRLFKNAIARNDSQAMYVLASLLSKGEHGIRQNMPEAAELLSRSTDEGGNVDAMNLLGSLLVKGENGVEMDVPRAVRLFSRAIDEGGQTDAMYNLASVLQPEPKVYDKIFLGQWSF